MRFREGLALGGGIFGATLFLACFPDYYFFDPVVGDGGEETSVVDAGRDASIPMDAADAFHPLDASADVLDAMNERDADADPLDAPDGDGS